jgi:hypothetical protein
MLEQQMYLGDVQYYATSRQAPVLGTYVCALVRHYFSATSPLRSAVRLNNEARQTRESEGFLNTSRALREKCMTISPVGIGTESNCAGKDQQQFYSARAESSVRALEQKAMTIRSTQTEFERTITDALSK